MSKHRTAVHTKLTARRVAGAAVLLTVLAASLGAAPGAVSAASGALTVSTPWGPVGGVIRAKATGCSSGDDDFTFRYPVIRVITGVGGNAVVAAQERTEDARSREIQVPGWVDPAQPAFVAAFCMQDHQGPVDGVWTVTTSTVFAYDEVPVDILPAPGPDPVPFISYTLDRSTAQAGQFITASGTGCPPNGIASLTLVSEADMSGRSGMTVLTGEEPGIYRAADAAGAFTVKIALNAYLGHTSTVKPAPVPVGPHWLRIACSVEAGPGVDAATTTGRPVRVNVSATNPTDSHVITYGANHTVIVSGTGCTGGRQVTLVLDGFIGGPGVIRATKTVVPAADGSWRFAIPGNGTDVQLESHAECGDPSSTGFQYVQRFVTNNADHTAVTAVSPVRVKAGDTITATVVGSCHEAVEVQVVDDGEVLAHSDPVRLADGDPGIGVKVVAPDRNGTFTVAAPCNWSKATTQQVEVFGATASSGAPEAPPATPVPGAATFTG